MCGKLSSSSNGWISANEFHTESITFRVNTFVISAMCRDLLAVELSEQHTKNCWMKGDAFCASITKWNLRAALLLDECSREGNSQKSSWIERNRVRWETLWNVSPMSLLTFFPFFFSFSRITLCVRQHSFHNFHAFFVLKSKWNDSFFLNEIHIVLKSRRTILSRFPFFFDTWFSISFVSATVQCIFIASFPHHFHFAILFKLKPIGGDVFPFIGTDWSVDWQVQEKSHDTYNQLRKHRCINIQLDIYMCWNWTTNFSKLKNSLHDKVIAISITIVIAVGTRQAIYLQWISTFWHLAIAFEIQSIVKHMKRANGHHSAYCIVEDRDENFDLNSNIACKSELPAMDFCIHTQAVVEVSRK